MNPSDSTSNPIALPPAPMPGPGSAKLVPTSSALLGLLSSAGDGGPPLPPALTGAPTMAGLGHALRRRWPLAVSLAAAATVSAVAAVFFFMPAKYPVEVRILVSAHGDAKIFGEGNDEPDFLLY